MDPKHEQPNSVPTIFIPTGVNQGGICPPGTIAEALGHLHHSGIVVLANVVDVAHVDALNAILTPQAAILGAQPGQHFNFGAHTGNINQAPPVTESLMFSDVWANPIVLSILSAVLGPAPVLHYACGNTVLPAPAPALAVGRQPVHSDIEFPHPGFPFSFVVNVPLIDLTTANGATEVWLGSHAATSFYDQILVQDQDVAPGLPVRAIIPALVERRRAISPPVRAVAPRGSIVIRDLRLWHAGLPNLTSTPRIMLAFVWQAAWWRGRGLVRLPLAARATVESWERSVVPFRIATKWLDGPVDYLATSSLPVDTSLASSDPALLEAFS
ncbi:hypothetical protein EG329_011373 [Mollisiaceae sp. DMI_Dod_QoI]|nr:hypothetical protein EG329_011373 [Helotiales sp. DMI_Dod_QoI]